MKSPAQTTTRLAVPLFLRFEFEAVILLPLCALALSACSTVKAKVKPDLVSREGIESARLLDAIITAPFGTLDAFARRSGDLLRQARKLESGGHPIDAAGFYLKAAVDSGNLLASGTEIPNSEAEQALIDVHNRALARFAEIWATDPRRKDSAPERFTCDGQTFEKGLHGSCFEVV